MQHPSLYSCTRALALDLFLGSLAQGSLSGFLRVDLPDHRDYRLVISEGRLAAVWGVLEGAGADMAERSIMALTRLLEAPDAVYRWEVADHATVSRRVAQLGYSAAPLMACLMEAARRLDERSR